MSCPTCQKALRPIVEALDLDYSPDFEEALWDALRILSPELYDACEEGPALWKWLVANAEEPADS